MSTRKALKFKRDGEIQYITAIFNESYTAMRTTAGVEATEIEEITEDQIASTSVSESDRKSNLESTTRSYQATHMSPNEASAILGAKLAGAVLGTKSQDNLDWLEGVWTKYYVAIADGSLEIDFSDVPDKKWLFAELQAEAGL